MFHSQKQLLGITIARAPTTEFLGEINSVHEQVANTS
jgi:hypothetical protein